MRVTVPMKADTMETHATDHIAFATTKKRTARALCRTCEAIEKEYAA